MKKSDLKTGMIVTFRNGKRFMVFLDASIPYLKKGDVLVNVNGGTWMGFANINEDLTSCNLTDYDIMKVEQARIPTSLVGALLHPNENLTKVIWERKEKKRYTYAQLKTILGEEFEVVTNATDVKEMTLDDLKTGMIVTLRDGMQCMVYKDNGLGSYMDNAMVDIKGDDYWHRLEDYNEDLTNAYYDKFDIVKVEKATHPYAFIRLDYEADSRKVLWERKRKYTYDQLKEKLGEEFEIVKE